MKKKFMVYNSELVEVLQIGRDPIYKDSEVCTVKHLVGYDDPFFVKLKELSPVTPEVRRTYKYMHDHADTFFPKSKGMFTRMRQVLMAFAMIALVCTIAQARDKACIGQGWMEARKQFESHVLTADEFKHLIEDEKTLIQVQRDALNIEEAAIKQYFKLKHIE